MSQSNVIAAYIALAFLVFVTMKGELPVYLGYLLSTPKQSGDTAPGATKDASASNVNVSDLVSTGFKLAAMV